MGQAPKAPKRLCPGRAKPKGRVSSCAGPGPKARSGGRTLDRSLQYKDSCWRPTHRSGHRRSIRSVLQFSFECGLRPYAKKTLGLRSPPPPSLSTLHFAQDTNLHTYKLRTYKLTNLQTYKVCRPRILGPSTTWTRFVSLKVCKCVTTCKVVSL